MPSGPSRSDRLQRALIIVALCYGLIYAAVSAGDQWQYRRGKAHTIAIAPGRAIMVEVWPLATLAERFNPYSRGFFYFNPEAADTRWVAIWYQDNIAGTQQRLAVFTLPLWPFAVTTAGVWLVLAGVVTWRRARPAVIHSTVRA